MEGIKIKENSKVKMCRSKNYNYNFNKHTGYFERWGKTIDVDPKVAPFPEILDIEITERCNGVKGLDGVRKPCAFCYKGNGPTGNNMSLKSFKTIIDKMPWLTQIALGSDAQGITNPDMFKMMEYARSKGIIPNLTIADVSDEVADKLSKLCGAVAISRYSDKNICYDSVKKLTDRGMNQCNIHMLISKETLEQAYETIEDIKTDRRLEKLNAVVFLSLKQKNRGEKFNTISQEEFDKLIEKATEAKINYGMDSCSSTKFLSSIKDREDFDKLNQVVEKCESCLMSSYLNSSGQFFPCSFTEGTKDWEVGIDVTGCKDFVKDVWFNERTKEWRKKLLANNRNCPIYKI